MAWRLTTSQSHNVLTTVIQTGWQLTLASRQSRSHSEVKLTAQSCCSAARSVQCAAERCWPWRSRGCRPAPASTAATMTPRCHDYEICLWSLSSCLMLVAAWPHHWRAYQSLWEILEARPRTESEHIEHSWHAQVMWKMNSTKRCMLYALRNLHCKHPNKWIAILIYWSSCNSHYFIAFRYRQKLL